MPSQQKPQSASNRSKTSAPETAHSITVRKAQLSDLDKLVALENRVFTYDQIGRRSFRYLLQRPSVQVWVAELTHNSVPGAEDSATIFAGYTIILTRKNSRKWRVYSLATAPEARGKGAAKALMNVVQETAENNPNVSTVSLEVKCDNAGAIALYRNLGFEVVDVMPNYYSDGSDGYRLQISL
ncbi:MAG: GNAT family N-acetyltransferase [Idiomarina sp.]|nr:GNAT family N-acetyltransferase [Idiomarina sp.]